MDFFKSVFSDDPPDAPRPGSASESPEKDENQVDQDPHDQNSPTIGGGGGGWSFGVLIKTLTTKSESVIDTYRRDLREFGSGLKKEIEVAHGSLENVGQAIDELGTTVLKGTAQIISQGKDAILAADLESDSDNNSNSNPSYYSTQQSLNSKPYSRFEAQIRVIQGEEGTYCEEPEDLDDYNRWKSGFDLEEKGEEIEALLEENGAMESVHKRVVPNSVDNETFWCRYFYRVNKLKQAEHVRTNLVKRAISREEEELSWDVDDDDEDDDEEEGKGDVALKGETMKNKDGVDEGLGRIAKDGESGVEVGKKSLIVEEVGHAGGDGNVGLKPEENRELGGKDGEKIVEESSVEELQGRMGEKSQNVEEVSGASSREPIDAEKSHEKMDSKGDLEMNKDLVSNSDEKVGSEGKAESGESCKGSDFSVVSTQPSMPEEEDLGWDEIEDLSSIDEKKESQSMINDRAEVRNRLSAADEEEDLSWDIEDDDEPAKP